MKQVLLLALILFLVVLWPATAFAPPPWEQPDHNGKVIFAVHAADHPTGKVFPPPCPGEADSYDPNSAGIDFTDYDTDRFTNEYPGPWLYVVAARGGTVGIKGVSFGINYKVGDGWGANEVPDPGIAHWILTEGYVPCADGLSFPSAGPNGMFPEPGGGLRITWESCQTQVIGSQGVHAVIAKFYAYAYTPDVFEITPNNNLESGPELDVTNCDGVTAKLLELNSSVLWPYIMGRVQFGRRPVSVEATSWGRLKTLFATD